MESAALKKLHKEVGDSIHSMNTIAVGLSLMSDTLTTHPSSLRISWAPKNLKYSKRIARSYAERSAIVYATESFFEYLKNISTDPFWKYPEINFKGEDKKADKVHKFLTMAFIDDYLVILTELLCHWRNVIVHLNSEAKLNKAKVNLLLSKKTYIYENMHHFDITKALLNFDQHKITLKDSSTLITASLKSAELIDKLFLKGVTELTKPEEIFARFIDDPRLKRIYNQRNNPKRNTQIKKWIQTNYPYFSEELLDQVCNL